MEENNVATMQQESATDTNVGTSTTAVNETPKQATEQSTQQSEPKQAFKVKYLHEEKEIPYEEAPTYIQKGMDYDRVRAKYEESKPVLSFVESLAQQNGMSVPDYLKAVEDYQRQQEIEALASQRSLDPELAEELYLLRQERQQREVQKQQQEVQERQNKEYVDFLNAYPDLKPEEIPTDVWRIKAEEGLPLKAAYKIYKAEQLESQLNTKQANQKNAEASTGSLTGNGSSSQNYISFDTFQKNKNDRNWVIKNFKQINDSRSKW